MTIIAKAREANDTIQKFIRDKPIAVFTRSDCEISKHFQNFLQTVELDFNIMFIDEHVLYLPILNVLNKSTSQKSPPFVFVKQQFVGNHESVLRSYHNGLLMDEIAGKGPPMKTDFEVIVIGGSSEGLAMAVDAGNLGKSVGLFDNTPFDAHNPIYPTAGSMTGNGALTKLLMIQAGVIGESCTDSHCLGWNFNVKREKNYNWNDMINGIKTHIQMTNEGFKIYTSDSKMKIFSARVLQFLDEHTVLTEDINRRKATFTGQVFVIATGGLPKTLTFPGSEYAISIEGLLRLTAKPIKVLVVGSGPVALEYAGILNSLGIEVTVLVSKPLMKRFDVEMTNKIVSHLQTIGVSFMYSTERYEIVKRKGLMTVEYCPTKICTVPENRSDASKSKDNFPNLPFRLKLANESTDKIPTGKDLLFDIILMATGRFYETRSMNLEQIGVKLREKNGKIIVNKYDRSDCHTVFAIGDVAYLRPELVSAGVKSGQFLARRMLGYDNLLVHDLIPMAVFTPLQYGFCGYTQERAILKYHRQNINIYETNFYPLQWLIRKKYLHCCYMKLICSKLENDKVVGVHILGPNAAEIIQGIGLAMRLNITKSDLDQFVGIHPSDGEALFGMQKKGEYKPGFVNGIFVTSIQNKFE